MTFRAAPPIDARHYAPARPAMSIPMPFDTALRSAWARARRQLSGLALVAVPGGMEDAHRLRRRIRGTDTLLGGPRGTAVVLIRAGTPEEAERIARMVAERLAGTRSDGAPAPRVLVADIRTAAGIDTLVAGCDPTPVAVC